MPQTLSFDTEEEELRARLQAQLHHHRSRRRGAQDFRAFAADIATPVNMGTVAATNPLTTDYVMKAQARLAVSFSAGLTAGQLTIDIGTKTLGTPALTADEIHRLDRAEINELVNATSAIAGTVTIYVMDEWSRFSAVATGVFT